MSLDNSFYNRLEIFKPNLSSARHFYSHPLSAQNLNFCFPFHNTHNNYLLEIIFKGNEMIKFIKKYGADARALEVYSE